MAEEEPAAEVPAEVPAPPAEAPAAVPAPMSWDVLVQGLSIAPHELAHRLLQKHGALDVTVRPSTFASLVTPSNNNSANALLLRQSSSEELTYTLVVLADRVAVLYDFKEMFELDAQGGRYAALAGEARTVAGQMVFPDLYHQPGLTSRTGHRTTFTTREVAARPWDEIATTLGEDEEAIVVAPAAAPEGGAAAPTLHAHQSLPLPPTLAILFLRMPTLRRAFAITSSLRELVPAEHHGLFTPLFNFMRAAITRDTDEVTRSALHSGWAKRDLQAGTPLETRYYSMVGKLVPTPEPSITTAPSPAPNAGEVTTQESRNSDLTTTDTEKSKYQTYELRTLWSLSGYDAETFPALTEAALPQFWQQFKKHRASNTEARNFMESFLRTWKTTERIVTPFIWQPSVIRAARTVNFGSDDIAFHWEFRDRGFSYLMLGPHEAFNSGSHVTTTDDWKIVELAEDDGKLTLDERRASRRSGGMCPAVPADRMTTVRHMECVSDKLLMMFGTKNPITPYLQTFVRKISEDAVMGSWQADDWKALNWLVASGVRKVFNECHQGVDRDALAFLIRINNDLSQGRRFSRNECPSQLFSDPAKDAEAKKESLKRKQEGLGRLTGKKGQFRTQPAGSAHPIAENFATMLEEAKEALGNKRFGVGMLLQSKADLHYVLGKEFLALVKDGEPCMKFFFKRCYKDDCPFGHDLSSMPSKAIIEGIVKRFKAKLKEYVTKEAAKK